LSKSDEVKEKDKKKLMQFLNMFYKYIKK